MTHRITPEEHRALCRAHLASVKIVKRLTFDGGAMPSQYTNSQVADNAAEPIVKTGGFSDSDSDTHPKDGDVKQAPLVSGAAPKGIAQ